MLVQRAGGGQREKRKKRKKGKTHLLRGLGVHNEQLGVVQHARGLPTAFAQGKVLLSVAGK